MDHELKAAAGPATVTVDVDRKGNFAYSEKSKKVVRGAVVEWVCDHDFAVDFCVEGQHRTPFGQDRRFQSGPPRPDGKRVVRATVAAAAEVGKYSYFVAAYADDERGRKVVWTDDPDIIVTDPEDGDG